MREVFSRNQSNTPFLEVASPSPSSSTIYRTITCKTQPISPTTFGISDQKPRNGVPSYGLQTFLQQDHLGSIYKNRTFHGPIDRYDNQKGLNPKHRLEKILLDGLAGKPQLPPIIFPFEFQQHERKISPIMS